MPRYLNTATHPIDLGTGAFAAPQQQVDIDSNDTIAEHVESGRLVELVDARRSARKPNSEEES